jgi:neurotransmitter:Na+ symporter, NSS family
MAATSTRWNSRISFIFAASAAAIGLGNIWRFPYLVGQNGGGAFVLIYLGFVVLLGVPLLIAEMIIGRIGRHNPAKAMASVSEQSNHSRLWGMAGGITIIAAFLILSYYVVIIGWVLDYFVRAITGQFAHATEASSIASFAALRANHWRMVFSDSLVVLGTMSIIIFGIKRGLERAVMIMFPALLILMLILLGYALTTSGFHEALIFLFKPDLSEVTSHTILIALGQAFFSLNIAMAITMMFSAYLPKKTPIISSAIAIAIADTGFAILSGLIIFPIVFTYHLKVNAGPSLIFQTLPIAFGQLPYGTLIASLFFLLLFFAAFTSSIALIEPAVSWMMERFHIKRISAVLITGTGCWLLSLGSIFSFTEWKNVTFFGKTFYQFVDMITAGIMLPLGGMLIALFTGWFIKKQLLENELAWKTHHGWYRVWQFILRYFAPIAILLILLMSCGVI